MPTTEEKEAKRARVEDEEEEEESSESADLDLETLRVYLAIGEMEEYNSFIVFDPKSTPKHAARLIEAMQAAIDREHAPKSVIVDYLSGEETLADLEAQLTTSPVDSKFLNRDIRDIKKYVPAWLQALTREEKGRWETIAGDRFPNFGHQRIIFDMYQSYQ